MHAELCEVPPARVALLPRPPVGTGAGRQGRFSTGYGVIASLSHWEKRKRGPRVPNEDLFHRNMIETGGGIEQEGMIDDGKT